MTSAAGDNGVDAARAAPKAAPEVVLGARSEAAGPSGREPVRSTLIADARPSAGERRWSPNHGGRPLSISSPTVPSDAQAVFARGAQRPVMPLERFPHAPIRLLPWAPGGDIVVKDAVPEGPHERPFCTNVALSCSLGSAGLTWGYDGSGPLELAVNILNQVVPPGADGLPAVTRHGPYWAPDATNVMSRTAFVLAEDFMQEFLVAPRRPKSLAGLSLDELVLACTQITISGAEIEAFVASRLDQVRNAPGSR